MGKDTENNIVDDMKVPEEEPELIERGNWTGKLDFLLSAIGYAVGLGNVWRFPYVCYKNGGGVFLIPYIIMLTFAGLPLFFFELGFGQFASLGPITIWRVAPIFRGVGIAMIMVSGFCAIYYNVIIAWTFYFLFVSFTAELPWQGCHNEWNTAHCRNLWWVNDTVKQITRESVWNMCSRNTTVGPPENADLAAYCLNFTTALQEGWNVSLKVPNLLFSSEEHWFKEVLDQSPSIEQMGYPQWKLVLCLLGAWLLIIACLSKGVASSGKVVYFTATFPYLVLVILFFRGVTLQGAGTGIAWYLTPKWEKLANPEIWANAATQIFYSLGPAFGGLITMASYNPFKNNFYRDALIVSVLNCGTSVFAGFVIFSVVGYMADQLGVDPQDVAKSGPGLAFIVYPAGIAEMPAPPVWSIMFFLMLITLGLDSQFVMMETIISALVDEWPEFLRPRKLLLTIVLCIVGFLLGLTNIVQGGNYVLYLLDQYASAFSLLIIALCELIIMQWVYGQPRVLEDFEMMLGFKPNWYWRICWRFVTPLLIVGIFIFSMVQYQPIAMNEIAFPGWANALGWILVAIPVFMIPITALFERYTHFNSWREAIQPQPEWGPANPEDRTGRYAKSAIDYYPSEPISYVNGDGMVTIGEINPSFAHGSAHPRDIDDEDDEQTKV